MRNKHYKRKSKSQKLDLIEKKRNLRTNRCQKRIELINWVLENMKNPDVEICNLIESKMNEIILAINQTYSIFESDKLHNELRILE